MNSPKRNVLPGAKHAVTVMAATILRRNARKFTQSVQPIETMMMNFGFK